MAQWEAWQLNPYVRANYFRIGGHTTQNAKVEHRSLDERLGDYATAETATELVVAENPVSRNLGKAMITD